MSYSSNDFFSTASSQIISVKEEFKKELSLEYDDYQKPLEKDNLMGLARLILNLLFLEPGTYPNSPEMGINIQKYQFELMTKDFEGTLQSKITEQIDTYISSSSIRQILVKTLVKDSKKTIGIGFRVALPNNKISESDENDESQFFITVSQLPDTRELVSQIII